MTQNGGKNTQDKIKSIDELAENIETLRTQRKKIVYIRFSIAHGNNLRIFDLFI